MSQLHVNKQGTHDAADDNDENNDEDTVDGTTTSIVRDLLSTGFRVGLQYGVVDSVLLHLYAALPKQFTRCCGVEHARLSFCTVFNPAFFFHQIDHIAAGFGLLLRMLQLCAVTCCPFSSATDLTTPTTVPPAHGFLRSSSPLSMISSLHEYIYRFMHIYFTRSEHLTFAKVFIARLH